MFKFNFHSTKPCPVPTTTLFPVPLPFLISNLPSLAHCSSHPCPALPSQIPSSPLTPWSLRIPSHPSSPHLSSRIHTSHALNALLFESLPHHLILAPPSQLFYTISDHNFERSQFSCGCHTAFCVQFYLKKGNDCQHYVLLLSNLCNSDNPFSHLISET